MGTNTGTWGSQLWGGTAPVPQGGTLNQTLIRAALRKAGVTLAPGRGPSPEQLAEAIGEENRMIGGWNCNPLAIFTNSIDLVNTIANQQSYTIGKDPSGQTVAEFDLVRPQEIIWANMLLPTASDPITKVRRKLKIWTDTDWLSIQFQAVYTYPEGLYYDQDCDPITGFAKVYFRPIPDDIYQIELLTPQQIPNFQRIDDIVLLPPGYEDAIVNNLAVRLATMPWTVQVPMNPQVRIDAITSLARIEQQNIRVPRLRGDRNLTSGRGTFNWFSGTYDET